jgi:hypothetical protein
MMSKRQERAAHLRAKHPNTTGIYRRPGPEEVKPNPSLEFMLNRTEQFADETLGRSESTPEAKANAREARLLVEDLRMLLANPSVEKTPSLVRNWGRLVATYAMATGAMMERLWVRRAEDYALHGRDVAAARVKGGEATGGKRRASSCNWRPGAQVLAEQVWKRHPDWSKSRVAAAIADDVGIAAATIRQRIKTPKKLN